MGEREKQQKAYLMVLICCTIFTVVLAGESMLLKWERSTSMLLLVGVLICWWIHITKKLAPQVSLWADIILTMITFFFYGSHETSIYDLAPVAIILMILYASTENKKTVDLCMATYYITMLYDFVVVLKGFSGFDSLMVTRTLLHLGLVYMGWYVIGLELGRRSRERSKTEEKIIQLEETNRRTEDFLTNVSHELRTPINAVTGITTTMLRTEENEARRNDIQSIQMAGHRLFNQVEDILDFTELDTGRIKISEENYMVSSLINDIIESKRLSDHVNKVELIIDMDAAMPSVLKGDGRKIKKIIKHLIDNGLKFTKVGGVYVKIYTMPKAYGVNLCIKVSDTGIGMSEEELLKVKERFYQNNSGRDRKTGGLGLGLSIVYGLVAAMEGFIQVESVVGKGTTISISIPQQVVDASSNVTLRNKEELFLACFLKPEKYTIPEVRTYYNEMIASLVSGLDIPLRRISTIEELGQLVSKYQLTHLFVGKEEYLEHASELEQIDQNTEIIVVSDEEKLQLPKNGQFKLLKKPFYCLPVVNILNADQQEEEYLHSGDMSCPGVKVLVVDDEPMNLMVAEGIFKGYDMEVKTAAGGKEAIEMCSRESFDLIFLDHMMPEMDGVETLKRLRKLQFEDEKLLTIIAFTANAVSGAREMFLKEGFDEFISKPIEDCELQRILRKVLPKTAIVYKDKQEKDADVAMTVKNIEALSSDISVIQKADKKQSETEKTEQSQLESIGLEVQKGLANCGRDEAFYRELLIKYAQESEGKRADMQKFFEEENWDDYRIRVHALKSTSKMIGEESLSEMARLAEDAAKSYDAAYIQAHHDEVLDKYRRLTDGIFSILCSEDDDEKAAEKTKEYRLLATGQFIDNLSEMRECFETFEAERAEELIKQMEGYQWNGESIDQLLMPIKEDVDDFEFEAAIQKIDGLIDRVKGGAR